MESPGREEETYVLVEYAFEYTSKDGQVITIKPNERYILLRRTNDHWWHVRKSKNSRPFYIPAKYVRELNPFMPSERPCHTTQLEAINLGTSIGVANDQLPDYEYRFVTAVQECKTDTSQQYPSSLWMGTLMSLEDNGKNLHNSGAARGTQLSLSASYSGSAEHMRPAVSLNDLPRFTPPTQTDVENSGLYKTASWTQPHPFLKNSSENIRKLVKDQVIQDILVPGKILAPWDAPHILLPMEAPLEFYAFWQLLPPPGLCLGNSLNNWEIHTDTKSGHFFYYNSVTGQTTWESPFGAPFGDSVSLSHSHCHSPVSSAEWSQYVDKASGQIFFYNAATGETSWEAPQETFNPPVMRPAFTRRSSDQRLKSLEKAGMLYRTRTADKGKRLSNPEFNVNLHGASLSWAHKDRSSRKNVLELKTRDGSEYLIQHDLDSIASMWHSAISHRIGRLSIDFPLEVDDDNLAAVKSKEQTRGSKEKESEKNCPFAAFWHSPGSDNDSSKIRYVLRKFLLKRPSLQYLRDRGYIRDQVFGCSLQVLCDREKSTVPYFVRQCIATVEKRGLDIDGLYRISGNLATIQNLRFRVDHDEYLDLDSGQWDDVHVITGALKLFFRELPEPLFPFGFFNRLIAAADPAKRRHHLREVVYSLPPANFNTSRVLFQHLSRVVEFREKNRMSQQSIAIVFGPTLLRPQDEEGNIAMYMFFQNQVMEQILSQTSYIFPES
uniref:Rho GTPase activating protein 27 n=1 Tax=Pseudonaja textilis TaxID=8673 RepID=A0A670ZPJ0_PSETE